ncbi:uncharacterized protein BCR38DRAFT_435795 [Pseudomassariella vexata]|uniref:Uncharacterized protein n=1 Tax=Pseudomassariella vexata TaxID=1141098 RepID=A0A1Y2DUW7_9PEZI|nr:uncharacterized protein BCR38DRAFT_435795 [Pseudomassariella vexata]ORY63063.1 hypothetical protein BCR38DRAFT_435795 [Pseudomassariella vexata]
MRTGETLEATRLFSSFSPIVLLAAPLSSTLEAILDLHSTLACFDRTQSFLSRDSRHDPRFLIAAPWRINRHVLVPSLGMQLRDISFILVSGGTVAEVLCSKVFWERFLWPLAASGCLNLARRGVISLLFNHFNSELYQKGIPACGLQKDKS